MSLYAVNRKGLCCGSDREIERRPLHRVLPPLSSSGCYVSSSSRKPSITFVVFFDADARR
jgi:hypothetical protein